MRDGTTIWIDVEDIVDYFRFNPHPSGIQRVALDIVRALMAAAPERLRFVRHAEPAGSLREVAWSDVATMLATPPIATAPPEEEEQEQRPRVQRAILGLPPELRDPLFRAGVLQSQVLRNGRALLHLVRPPAPRPIRPEPAAAPVSEGGGPAPGELFLALGAPWSVRGSAAVLARLRERGVGTALLLHDLIPVRRPEWFPPARVERFRRWLEAGLRDATHLLTLSRFTADDVADYAGTCGIAANPATPLPAGGSTLSPGGAVPVGLPVAGSYVLFVSTLEARKNHALAVRVWHRLMAEVRAGSREAESVPQLVFAGRVGEGVADLLQQLDNSRWLAGRIRLIREPDDPEVHALYRNCRFTLLPSLFEGWGLTLGESLACGKPCLAASGTALPEAGGDLCRYFDPEDTGDAHRAVTAVVDSPDGLAAWEAEVRARYRRPSWDAAAAAILDLAA